MIVDTEKVLREADGPVTRRVERWSPRGAPQTDGYVPSATRVRVLWTEHLRT